MASPLRLLTVVLGCASIASPLSAQQPEPLRAILSFAEAPPPAPGSDSPSAPQAGTSPPATTPGPVPAETNANPAGARRGLEHDVGQIEGVRSQTAYHPDYGPTPLNKVGIFQGILFGDEAEESKVKVGGWIESDYTYRSTGSGLTTVAPMMNRFGDEFLARELGLTITRKLDPNEWSWGFNVIYFGGSDAAVINPTRGWINNPDPRFSQMFTDLNLTAHLPILTDGGVDVKAGRQTSVLGPMGALGWQRWFGSSDYGWFNLEEGRFTGVTANWHITKQLSWYNGFELGWGTFFAQIGNDVDYITQIVYWLDPEANRTKTWLTVLTGPTSVDSNKVTTVVETGFSNHWTERFYQVVNFQMVYANGPVNAPVPLGYLERAWTVYTYPGYHLTSTLDLITRFEYYKDVDGRNYAGGYGVAHTDYFEMTYGVDYHPTKWLQFRPEIRYDHASNPNFGQNHDDRDQLTLATNVLIKF